MFLSGLWSLQSFIWVSWGYLPSTDTMCRPQFCCFLPSFLCCYVFSKWNIYFFILVFPNLILFCPSLFWCNTFPVSYFLSFSCLSLHILYFLSLSLSVFYFLSSCLLSFSSDFLCLSSTFYFCFCLFLYLLLSFLAFFYFLLWPVFYYIPLTLLFIFSCMCVLLLLLLCYSSFLYSVPFSFL